jgi:hypothetical protein
MQCTECEGPSRSLIPCLLHGYGMRRRELQVHARVINHTARQPSETGRTPRLSSSPQPPSHGNRDAPSRRITHGQRHGTRHKDKGPLVATGDPPSFSEKRNKNVVLIFWKAQNSGFLQVSCSATSAQESRQSSHKRTTSFQQQQVRKNDTHHIC